jgi:hypothetical protein
VRKARVVLEWSTGAPPKVCGLCGWDSSHRFGRLVVDGEEAKSYWLCDACQSAIAHLHRVLGGTYDEAVDVELGVVGGGLS